MTGTKKVVIVGGGIAGLSAGIYAKRCGFDALVLERNALPGGNSTSWRRGGFLFEGGMHWLVGSSASAPLHRLWTETGALDKDTAVYNRDPFLRWSGDGEEFCLYRDAGKLKAHLLQAAPEDARAIKILCRDIRRFSKMNMPVFDIKGVKCAEKNSPPLSMLLGMIQLLPRLSALSKISVAQYLSMFKRRGLRELLSNVVGRENFSAASLLFTLGGFASGDGGYPEGGSLGMARRMLERFVSLGGRILFNTEVQKIVVRDGRVCSVKTNAADFAADAVIVASDTMSALDSLFEERDFEPWAKEMRDNTKPVSDTFVSLGVEADLSGEAENILFPLKEPIDYAGKKITVLGLNNYAAFKGYAPEGSTSLTTAFVGDDYDWWLEAKKDGSYEQKKEALAKAVIGRIEERFPKTRGKFVVYDVATPLTYERYCKTWRGSWMSVLEPGGRGKMQYPQKSQVVQGLYYAGQRMMKPGGLPVAVSTGRSAVQYLCADTGTLFDGAKSLHQQV